MNIDTIVNKIAEEARAAASQTLENARRQADDMQAEAARKAEEAHAQAQADAGAEVELLRERMLRTAALAQKRDELVMKREVMDEAFTRALHHLESMPAETAQRLALSLLLENAAGDEQIAFAEADMDVFSDAFLAEANAAMQSAGKQGALSYAADRLPTRGGFVLRRGGMQMEMTWEAVLSVRRASMEAEVADMLFSQGGNA